MNKTAQFCGSCGHSTATVRPGLLLTEAKAWRETFWNMGWIEEPASNWEPVVMELIRTMDFERDGAGRATENHEGIFLTQVQHAPWKIYEFRIDGKRVETESNQIVKLLQRATRGGVVGNMMVKQQQTWIGATRDRLFVMNLFDKALKSWKYVDFLDTEVSDKGTFGFRTESEQVWFKVKRQDSHMLARIAMSTLFGAIEGFGKDLADYDRKHTTNREYDAWRQQAAVRKISQDGANARSANISFMSAIAEWLDRCKAVGESHRNARP
jgi:hypothetical protein